MMEDSDLDHLRDTPGFKPILRAILKSQMKHLVEQLSKHGGEEAMVLTASISDASFNHLGSTATEGFLDSRDDIMAQFLGYCTKGVQENEDHIETERSADDRFKDKVSPGTTSKNSSRPVSSAKQPSKSIVCPVSLIKVGEKTATEMDVQQTTGSKAGSTISSPKSGRGSRKRPSATVSSDKPPKRSTIPKTVTQALKAISADTGQEMEEETCGSVKVESDHGDPDFTKTEDSNSSDTLSLDLGSGTKDRHDIIKEFSETEQPGQSFDLDDLTEVKVEPADDDEVPDFEEDTDQLDFDVDTEAAAAEDGARSTETATKIEETRVTTKLRINKYGIQERDTMSENSKAEKEAELLELLILPGVLQQNTNRKIYICEICGASYARKIGLSKHLKKHDERYKFRCKTCSVYFITQDELDDHQQKTGCQKSHLCSCCGKAFGKNTTLKRHLSLVHNADSSVSKLFCPYENCSKKFIHKELYQGHLNKHEGVRPYSCSNCLSKFHDKYKKNKHELVCVAELVCQCDNCGKVFTDRSAMNRHKASHHGGKTFTCSCGNTYKYYSSLYKHKRSTEHPEFK